MTTIPLLINNSAVNPFPFISFPVYVPSYISPQPQDGLLDFSITFSTPRIFAIAKVFSAPSLYSLVQSRFSLLIYLLSPISFIIISQLGLGVVNPPSCSGQTGIAFPCITNLLTFD